MKKVLTPATLATTTDMLIWPLRLPTSKYKELTVDTMEPRLRAQSTLKNPVKADRLLLKIHLRMSWRSPTTMLMKKIRL